MYNEEERENKKRMLEKRHNSQINIAREK